ncbi:MAG: hypothetical protein HXY26_09900 [Hydrogenophilaceae bacterium]|nr:hypothetical protein [Hydrogenophilaceae bacterium]
MVDLLYTASEFLRPILFLALFFYLPMKFGFSFDIVAKPTTSEEVRDTQQQLISNLGDTSLRGLVRGPFRLLGIAYFTLWLAIDKCPKLIAALFFLTLLPVYLN